MVEPLVTVALQFYNNEATLAQAIRSIQFQTFTNWELLLQDDGSTDRSLEIAKHYCQIDSRIQLFSDGINKKRPARINEGLDLAKGKYFALMDSDDISYPNRLMRQVEYLETHQDIDLVGAHMLVFSTNGMLSGKRQSPENHTDICKRPWLRIPMAQPTFMGHTNWFRRYRYNERMTRTEDFDLLLRAYRTSKFANIPEILVAYRENSLSVRRTIYDSKFVLKSLTNELSNSQKEVENRYYFKPGIPLDNLRIPYVNKFQKHLMVSIKKSKHWGFFIAATVTLTLKTLLSCIAIGLGLNYKLLSHRAEPSTADERDKWRSILSLADFETTHPANLVRPNK